MSDEEIQKDLNAGAGKGDENKDLKVEETKEAKSAKK